LLKNQIDKKQWGVEMDIALPEAHAPNMGRWFEMPAQACSTLFFGRSSLPADPNSFADNMSETTT